MHGWHLHKGTKAPQVVYGTETLSEGSEKAIPHSCARPLVEYRRQKKHCPRKKWLEYHINILISSITIRLLYFPYDVRMRYVVQNIACGSDSKNVNSKSTFEFESRATATQSLLRCFVPHIFVSNFGSTDYGNSLQMG